MSTGWVRLPRQFLSLSRHRPFHSFPPKHISLYKKSKISKKKPLHPKTPKPEAAMAANSSSKKRKQPSSTGIFTRSKSQVHIGGNRSGRKRLLTTPTTTFQWSELPQGKPRGRYGPRSRLDEGQISHIAIKDLRAHRVFSCCNLDTDKPQILEDGCGYPDGTASLEGKIGVESLSPDRSLDDSTESSRDDPKAVAMKENAGFCDEKNVQMTPPDADIFSKPEVDEGEGNGAQCVSQSTEFFLLKQPCGNIRKNDSMSRSRSVKKITHFHLCFSFSKI